MIVKSENAPTIIKDIGQASKILGEGNPAWLASLRQESLERFIALGVPTVKDEEWKYTNLAPLRQHTFGLPSQNKLIELAEFQKYTSEDTILIVFVNGHFAHDLSKLNKLPKGITIETLRNSFQKNGAKLEHLFKKQFSTPENAFITLNQALVNDGVVITVDPKIIIEEPIHIVHVTSAINTESVIVPRTFISMGKSSEATVLESHVAFNDKIVYLSNPLTDIFMEDNSILHYCKAQKESLKAFHLGNTRVWQERNSNLDGFSIMTGGALTRNDLSVILNGEGINAAINGLYALNGTQHADNHTVVDHCQPNCTSNQLYKGILNGSSRGVFNGKIFVRPIAQKTNSYQLNKNLILGKNCQIDTKPQLEIFADDVKCTHGATIGQLNEDEMFYLQSRCISRQDAVKMLARGFVDAVLEKITNERIRAKLYILLEPTFAAL